MHSQSSEARKRRGYRFRRRARPYVFVAPATIMLICLMVVPIVTVAYYSLFDNVITVKDSVFVGLENYIKLFTEERYVEAFLNTIRYTVATVALHLVIAMVFALLLNSHRLSGKLKGLFRVVLILPWVFTGSIVAILWKVILNANGIANYLLVDVLKLLSGHVDWLSNRDTAMGCIIYMSVWAGYAFFMMSILAGLQGIPSDLYEAASIDGTNAVQKFIYITLPQLKPVLVSMCLLDYIWTQQQLILVYLTTGGGPVNSTQLLGTYTYDLAFVKFEFSMAAASGVVLLVLAAILAVFYVRNQTARD